MRPVSGRTSSSERPSISRTTGQRGQGFAGFLESARGADEEGAEIRFSDDGMIEARVGTEANGQGNETVFSRLVAERFGAPDWGRQRYER